MKKKLLILTVLISSLQFASVMDTMEFEFNSKIGLNKYLSEKRTQSKDENSVEIDYTKVRFSLPEINFKSGVDLSTSTKDFNSISMYNLKANGFVSYETPKFRDMLSSYFRVDAFIGPKVREGDLDFEAGINYYGIDNLKIYNGLKYESNKLVNPKILKYLLNLKYTKDETFNTETNLYLGGRLKPLVQSILDDEDKIVKDGVKNIVFGLQNKGEYKKDINKFNYDVKFETNTLLIDDYTKLIIEKKEENSTSEENKEKSTENTKEETQKKLSNTILTTTIEANDKVSNIYEGLYIDLNAKYINEVNLSSEKPKDLEKYKIYGYNFNRYINHELNLKSKLGYEYQINDMVKIDPYVSLNYNYKTDEYNEITNAYGMNINIKPIEHVTLDLGFGLPISFSNENIEKTSNKEFNYSKIGVNAFASFNYKW